MTIKTKRDWTKEDNEQMQDALFTSRMALRAAIDQMSNRSGVTAKRLDSFLRILRDLDYAIFCLSEEYGICLSQ